MNADFLRPLNALPTELVTRIYEEVNPIPTNTTITLDASYKPPTGLHINRSSRRTARIAYYHSNVFESADLHLTLAWLASLCLIEGRLTTTIHVFELQQPVGVWHVEDHVLLRLISPGGPFVTLWQNETAYLARALHTGLFGGRYRALDYSTRPMLNAEEEWQWKSIVLENPSLNA